jgi:hypothetical protein
MPISNAYPRDKLIKEIIEILDSSEPWGDDEVHNRLWCNDRLTWLKLRNFIKDDTFSSALREACLTIWNRQSR